VYKYVLIETYNINKIIDYSIIIIIIIIIKKKKLLIMILNYCNNLYNFKWLLFIYIYIYVFFSNW